MNSGKYRVKAINRAAAVDNAVIASLRAKVADLETQLSTAHASLERERFNQRNIAEAIAADQVNAARKEGDAAVEAMRHSAGVILDRLHKLSNEIGDSGSMAHDLSFLAQVAVPLADLAGQSTLLDGRKNTNKAGRKIKIAAGQEYDNQRLTRRQRRAVARVLEKAGHDSKNTVKPLPNWLADE